jgi:hypothetical protein
MPLVAVVVVLVPVAFGVPAVLVLVPPLMKFTPAMLASFVQFVALAICLAAVPPMFFDGLVQFMLGVFDAALAALAVVGVNSRDRGEQQDRRQYSSRKQRCYRGRKLVRRFHNEYLFSLVRRKSIASMPDLLKGLFEFQGQDLTVLFRGRPLDYMIDPKIA